MASYIDFINVGFGEATFIHLEHKNQVLNIFVDTGSDQQANYARDIRRISVRDYLIRQGIKSIDYIFITHFHEDHLSGIKLLLGEVKVEEVVFHLKPTWDRKSMEHVKSFALYHEVINLLEKHQVSYRYIHSHKNHHPEIVFYEYELYILLPILNQLLNFQKYEDMEAAEKEMNQVSMSILLRFRHKNECLITSDIPLEKLEHVSWMLEDCPVLQVPHHGDSNYVDTKMINIINPKWAIVSADAEGTYDLPSGDYCQVIEKLCQAKVLFTESKNSHHQYIRYCVECKKITLLK
jgi:competence protein ComEC